MLEDWSSIPLMAAPFLSTSKYWPKILKLEVSLSSNIQSDLMLTFEASSRSCPVNVFSENPSLSVVAKENFVLTVSDRGMFEVPLILVKP